MIKLLPLMICSILFLSIPSSNVNAGPFSEALGKCLVRSATPIDKVNMVKWIFFAMGEHPSLKSTSKVSEWEKTKNDKAMADLWTRLLTSACRKQTREGIKYEPRIALFSASKMLGRAAMHEIMTNTKVTKRIKSFSRFVDKDAMRRLRIK